LTIEIGGNNNKVMVALEADLTGYLRTDRSPSAVEGATIHVLHSTQPPGDTVFDVADHQQRSPKTNEVQKAAPVESEATRRNRARIAGIFSEVGVELFKDELVTGNEVAIHEDRTVNGFYRLSARPGEVLHIKAESGGANDREFSASVAKLDHNKWQAAKAALRDDGKTPVFSRTQAASLAQIGFEGHRQYLPYDVGTARIRLGVPRSNNGARPR